MVYEVHLGKRRSLLSGSVRGEIPPSRWLGERVKLHARFIGAKTKEQKLPESNIIAPSRLDHGRRVSPVGISIFDGSTNRTEKGWPRY